MYEDSDEEDLHEEEEVLQISAAFTVLDDSDDESAKPVVGTVAKEESQIPESISALGKHRKTVYKKRKLNHEHGSDSGTSSSLRLPLQVSSLEMQGLQMKRHPSNPPPESRQTKK